MAKGTGPPEAAFCADYTSDEGEKTETKRQANITVKRSGTLGKEVMAASPTPQPDVQSDSGYSSRTHATAASADSGKSVKSSNHAAASSEITMSSAASGSRKSAHSDGHKGTKCKDPNCKHRKKKSTSKTTSTTSAPKPTKTVRTQSPPRTKTPRAERQAEARPALRPRTTSSGQRPHSYYHGMPYPVPHPQQQPPHPHPQHPHPRMVYPGHYRGPQYPTGPAHVVVNRTVPRPAVPRLTTENLSARTINPSSAYIGTPAVVIQKPAKANTVLSARRPPTSSNFPELFDDDEEDEDSEEETESEDDSPTQEELMHMQRVRLAQQHMEKLRAHHELQLEERRKRAAQEEEAQRAAARAKELTERLAMPPPARPASAANGYSMRRPKDPALVTYDPLPHGSGVLSNEVAAAVRHAMAHNVRPSPNPNGVKLSSYPQTGLHARTNVQLDQGYGRRNSEYGTESVAELEARERALRARREQVEYALRRRSSQNTTNGYDPNMIRRQLQNQLQSLNLDDYEDDEESSDDDAGMKEADQLTAAQRHIEERGTHRSPRNANHIPGILRKAIRDRETQSIHSKRSSREGGSMAGRRRPSMVSPADTRYDDDGIRMRIDAGQEIEIGTQRVRLRPNDEGTIDVIIAGKRDVTYNTSKASSSSGSKLGRRSSRRAHLEDEEDSEEDDDEEYERDLRSERRSIKGGAARRRAETYSTAESEYRKRREQPRVASPERRSAPRVQPRRPSSPVESRYDGPPLYGIPPDEYRPMNNRFSQGSARSPNYGGVNQNYTGFGA